MKISFNKNIAVYIFSGLFICFLATVGFIYSQFKGLGDIKIVVAEKIEKLTGRNVSIGGAEFKFEKGISIRLQQLSIESLNGEDHEFLVKSAWCPKRSAIQWEISTSAGMSSFPTFLTNSIRKL